MTKNPSLVVVAVSLSFQASAMHLLAQSQAPEAPAPQQQTQPSLPDPSKLSDLKFKDEKVGDYENAFFKIEGFTMGNSYTIDEEFTTKYENKPPAVPFRITVPKSKQVLVIPGGKKSGLPELLKVVLATEDQQAVEILRFANLRTPQYEKVEDRLKVCAVILQEQALPMVGKGYTEHFVSEIYATKIRDLDAVVFNAQMKDPKSSRLYYLKVVGIPDPDSEAGLLAFSLSDSTLSDVKSKEDQSTKGFALRVLHSLQFVD